MLNNIFNPSNGFFRAMAALVDVVCFSLMWVMCAATLILLGPGTTALYDAIARCLRRGTQGAYARFWGTLKDSLRVGLPSGLAVAALGYALVKLHGALYAGAAAGDRTMFALYIAFWVAFAAVCGITSYLFPTLSRFEFSVGGLLATGVKLAFAHPLTTLALGLLTGACVLLCVVYWIPALFLPYVWAWLAAALLEPIFRPFMEEQGKSL